MKYTCPMCGRVRESAFMTQIHVDDLSGWFCSRGPKSCYKRAVENITEYDARESSKKARA